MDAEFVRSEVLTPGCQRLSCLCLLMKPNPTGRAVHRDQAGKLSQSHTHLHAELTAPGKT